ncbi:MAG: hypothetical protein N2510_05870, partial [Ignavibacteria bacterium]|nr:hypothetical protein [Ignavibacteria bacterium]
MKKIFTLFTVLFLLTLTNTSFSQLSGTYTIPGSYATILAAITDLNTQGVSGHVTFNIAAGHVETGANYIINVTGPKPNATRTVTFQKSGSGANPLIQTTAAGLG